MLMLSGEADGFIAVEFTSGSLKVANEAECRVYKHFSCWYPITAMKLCNKRNPAGNNSNHVVIQI